MRLELLRKWGAALVTFVPAISYSISAQKFHLA